MQLRHLFLPFLALFFLGAARPPAFTIRFHAAATKEDSPTFVAKVEVGNPPHPIYVKKVAEISERDVVAIWPFPAADGTMGCMLKLSSQGTLRLTGISGQFRGKPLICVVNISGKAEVSALMVDQQVTDGEIPIPNGLTPEDLKILRKQYRVLGETKTKKKTKEPVNGEDLDR